MSFNKDTEMYEGYIYKIFNKVNGKVYIGQTRRTIYIRWKEHIKCSMSEEHSTPLYKAIRKHGYDMFEIDKIDFYSSKSYEDFIFTLNKLEIYYIDKYNSCDRNYGYNIDSGGNFNIEHFKKPVDQYDLNGDLLKSWDSISDAGDSLCINSSSISSCCLGKVKTCGGFIWRYKGEDFHKYYCVDDRFNPVVKYDIYGNILSTYSNVLNAAKDNNCTSTSIINVCNGKQNTFNSFIFRYIDDKFDKYDTTESKAYRVGVNKYDLDGNYICNYTTLSSAAIDNDCQKSHISKVCHGDRMTCGGFVWRFPGDSFYKYPIKTKNINQN